MNNGSISARRPMTDVTVMNAFLRSVYNWMALGLGITAVLAYILTYTSFNSLLRTPQAGTIGIIGIVVELGLVFYLSLRINKLSATAASGIFLAYSALNGFTLSFLLMAYTQSSVAQAFITAAGMFAGMSVYGLYTKKDLAGWGGFLFMALIGLLVAMLVNLFLGSTMVEMLISFAGVAIFLGLTAYDTQLLKEMGESVPHDDKLAVHRGTILGALRLYLDFINLFIMLLRLVGDRR